VLTTALALGSWFLIERPVLRLVKRKRVEISPEPSSRLGRPPADSRNAEANGQNGASRLASAQRESEQSLRSPEVPQPDA
jgi:hypothetical protein